MKLTGTYNGKPIELELTEEQVEVLKQAEKKKTGWERVKNNKSYYAIFANGCGSITESFELNDTNKYEKANYFSEETLGENIARAQTLQRKLWRRSAELCEKANWNDNRCGKFSIVYDCESRCLSVVASWMINGFGQVYFDAKEHAEQVIEEFNDELIWYFTEFQSRMD